VDAARYRCRALTQWGLVGVDYRDASLAEQWFVERSGPGRQMRRGRVVLGAEVHDRELGRALYSWGQPVPEVYVGPVLRSWRWNFWVQRTRCKGCGRPMESGDLWVEWVDGPAAVATVAVHDPLCVLCFEEGAPEEVEHELRTRKPPARRRRRQTPGQQKLIDEPQERL
jgi:hypothetical protein